MQRVRIWSLVQELRSHVPYGAASKNYFKKKKSNKKEREKNKETQKTAEYNEKRDSVRSLY